MSLLSNILRDRWLIGSSQQESYFPIVLSMLEAVSNGKEFSAIGEKEPIDISVFGKHDFGIALNRFSGLEDRKAFSAGADHVREQLPEAEPGSIAVIPIKGEFMRYGTMCAWGADELAPVIKLAGSAKNISAVVLDFDSGGGAERAVPPFLQAISHVQGLGKPVVAHGDLCASAAYYVASHCDYIVADNKISSAFGSIGVMVSWPDFRKYYEQKGISIKDIYAPQSKRKNKSYRDLLDGKEETLKEELKRAAARFISNVQNARKGKFSDYEGIWEGEVFDSGDMKKHGLVDGFGDLMKSIEIAAALAEV